VERKNFLKKRKNRKTFLRKKSDYKKKCERIKKLIDIVRRYKVNKGRYIYFVSCEVKKSD